MSKDDKNESKAVRAYKVGYAKPPKSTQFKKGTSGNPSGRPKAAAVTRRPLKYELKEETFKETFLEEAYRMVSINTGAGEESIPIARAVTRALGVKAAKGHPYAQRLFAQTLFRVEAENRKTSEELMDGIVNYKKKWTEELKRRSTLGLPLDPPVPHPDDIIFDMVSGKVEVRGPLSPEEKEKRDFYGALLEEWTETKTHYESVLARPVEDNVENEHRKFFEAELEQCLKIIPMLEELSGKRKPVGLFEADKRMRRIE